MKLVIDTLSELEHLKYEYIGAVTVSDPHLICLDFIVKNGAAQGKLNVRGLIDMPLALKAQYDERSRLNGQPGIRHQIDKDLQTVSEKINRLL